METARGSASVERSQYLDELRQATGRLAHLEDRISQADYYIIKALQCRADGEIRHAITRIAHETLKGALHVST